MNAEDVFDTLRASVHEYRERHRGEHPRELRLSPRAYRAWRDAVGEYCRRHKVYPTEHRGADRFMDVPVRCTERIPGAGFVAV